MEIIINKNEALEMLANKQAAFISLSIELQEDEDLALAFIENAPSLILKFNRSFCTDMDFAKKAVKVNPSILYYCSKEIVNDQNIALEALQRGVRYFIHIGDDLKIKLEAHSGKDAYEKLKLLHDKENVKKEIKDLDLRKTNNRQKI